MHTTENTTTDTTPEHACGRDCLTVHTYADTTPALPDTSVPSMANLHLRAYAGFDGAPMNGVVAWDSPSYAELWSHDFATEDDALAFIAQFPKATRLKVCNTRTDSGWVFRARTTIVLAENGSNGGVNETGVKRIRSALARVEKLGGAVTCGPTVRYHAEVGNEYRTVADFLAALG